MPTLPPSLQNRLNAGFACSIDKTKSATGGCINKAAVILVGIDQYFVKWNTNAPPDFFEAEVQGLKLLRKTNTVRVPEPLAWSNSEDGCPAFLLMEFIPAPREPIVRRQFGIALGRQLAALHQSSPAGANFGLEHDNFIGTIPQHNTLTKDWITFLRDHRIGVQLKFAKEKGSLKNRQLEKVEKLMDRLPELIPNPETPSLLHGDLWSGNYMMGDRGEPVLIDPAVYRGHREMELAFTEMFGGFPEEMYDAYHEVFPIAPGYKKRRLLYQVYPLMVHVNLFGGAYAKELERAVSTYL